MITYQQFKNFFLHADRKVFYVLTYQNVVGCIIGWMLGRWLSAQLPFLPGPLCWLAGVVLGLLATWPHEGRARYRLVLLWTTFQVRRLLGERATLFLGAPYFHLPPAQGAVEAPGLLTYSTSAAGGLAFVPERFSGLAGLLDGGAAADIAPPLSTAAPPDLVAPVGGHW